MRSTLIVVLQSVSATCGWVAALFFLRFWRETHDRLFLYFAAAFSLLATSWLALALIDPTDEARPYVYAVRLVAFLLIVAAVIDKNRQTRRQQSKPGISA